MIPAVFDCNIIIAGLGWSGNPRACLSLVTGQQVLLCVTPDIWAEYEKRVPEVLADKQPAADPQPFLVELVRIANFVSPAPLGKQRSRDAKDDRYLAGALAAGAKFVVTNDRDLLDLEKPFGVRMVTPIQFLLYVRGQTTG
ncbi:MAG: putative toxin-antitoxin system toxin component, PIN family [Verrucomicrobiae bacterium]|nr:putative toxin-antitoxin system toxin component, PIN family [Verrucomicrobiae bacterium]